MDARTKGFLGVAMAALLLLMAIPSKGTKSISTSAAPAPHLALAAEAIASGATSVEAAPVNAAASREELERQHVHAATLTWGNDPFAPQEVDEPEPELPSEPAEHTQTIEIEPVDAEPIQIPLPHLSGVSVGNGARWAIIDRNVVGEGDWLPSGHRVGRIGRRDVIVELDGRRETLILGRKQ